MRKLCLLAAMAAVAIATPAMATDWFRETQAANWFELDQKIEMGGEHYVLTVGLPGSTEGNIVAAAIPREGDLQWLNFVFDCKSETGRVMQAWQTDRAGGSHDMQNLGTEYEPVQAGTLNSLVFDMACSRSSEHWSKIDGDVLDAAAWTWAAVD